MKKKIILILSVILGILLILWAGMFITDWKRSASLKMPVFAKAKITADDGGSGTYRGIGYRVEIECYPDAQYGLTVTSSTMTVFGQVVAASISDRHIRPEDDPQPSDWGVSFSVKDVTPNGLTLVVSQSGRKPEGELQTGSAYALYRRENGIWENVRYTVKGEVAWDALAYMIKENDQTEFAVDWSHLYGELAPGEYRLQKEVQLWRAPGDHDTNTHFADFSVTGSQAASDDWGIALSAEDVTKNGLRLIIAQSGEKPEGELQIGSSYVLERKREDQWEKAKFAVKGDVAWTSIAYTIMPGQDNVFDTDWSNLYGELSPGEYRISKEVQLWRAPGDYDTKTYFAEFTIDDDTPTGAVTYRAVDADASVRITGEEAGIIKSLLTKEGWTDGTADCLCDCVITLWGKDYYYHSECGTVNDHAENKSLTLTEDEKEQLHEILEKGIPLYYSGEKCPVE